MADIVVGQNLVPGGGCFALDALSSLSDDRVDGLSAAPALRSWGPCIAPSSSLGLGDVGEDRLSLAKTLAFRQDEFHSRRGQAGSTGNAP